MSLGPAEILVILVVALVVLGPSKLPEAARQVGKAMAEFRRVTAGFQAEVRDAFQDPAVPDPTPVPPPPSLSVEPVHVPPPESPYEPPLPPPPGPQLPAEPPAH
jgi:sec-independent protein translocase protein TatA